MNALLLVFPARLAAEEQLAECTVNMFLEQQAFGMHDGRCNRAPMGDHLPVVNHDLLALRDYFELTLVMRELHRERAWFHVFGANERFVRGSAGDDNIGISERLCDT